MENEGVTESSIDIVTDITDLVTDPVAVTTISAAGVATVAFGISPVSSGVAGLLLPFAAGTLAVVAGSFVAEDRRPGKAVGYSFLSGVLSVTSMFMSAGDPNERLDNSAPILEKGDVPVQEEALSVEMLADVRRSKYIKQSEDGGIIFSEPEV